MCSRWWPVVLTEISSDAATSLLVMPRATRRKTSISRSLSPPGRRSEEHTSELQSRGHLVCRLVADMLTTYIYTLSLHDALPILLHGKKSRRGACGDADLVVDVLEVVAGRLDRDIERRGDFLVGHASCDETQDLDLAITQSPGSQIGRAHV